MSEKHTPGPWEVEDRRHAPLKNIRIVAGNHDIAWMSDVHQRDYQAGYKRSDQPEADAKDAVGLANARLIAAAPELLAACKAALDAYDGAPLALDGCINGIRAAISKAEGRS